MKIVSGPSLAPVGMHKKESTNKVAHEQMELVMETEKLVNKVLKAEEDEMNHDDITDWPKDAY